jgi:putative lipoic acid-binding regulatory protein
MHASVNTILYIPNSESILNLATYSTTMFRISSLWMCACCLLTLSVNSFTPPMTTTRMAFLPRQSSPSPSNEIDPEEVPEVPEEGAEEDSITESATVGMDEDGSVFRINDGGSKLTDRFKYKVHALMGTYDPPAEEDNENETGHILNAMLQFPVTYSFNVVGRTSGDEAKKDVFVEQVKAAVTSVSGPDENMSLRITPRGKSFTKVVIQANVESAAMIANIYKELEQLEMSVMQF